MALADAPGRVLAEPLYARQDSPGQSTAAMDGYAVCDATTAPDQLLRVAGESRAGLGFPGIVSAGEAVRIFTGAPMPAGTDRCIVQEHAIREGGNDLARPVPAPCWPRSRGRMRRSDYAERCHRLIDRARVAPGRRHPRIVSLQNGSLHGPPT